MFKRLGITYSKFKYLYNLCLVEDVTKKVYRTFMDSGTLCNLDRRLNIRLLEKTYILGIETSCDDTAAAVIDGNGHILGESCASQVKTSVTFGGIVPSVAKKLHEKNIKAVVSEALSASNLTADKLTAISVTVKPGQTRSIKVGYRFAKDLSVNYNKPLIPIHHMEAHALTVRLLHKIDFPYIVLLVSGGHCLICVAQDIDRWTILGETLDEAPGVSVDQLARRMKLRNIPGLDCIAGGAAIEKLAEDGDYTKYNMPYSITQNRDANFSFSGLRSHTTRIVERLEEKEEIEGSQIISQVNDVCASFQYGITKHLVRQTHKALKYACFADLIDDSHKTLVLSGGVASNRYIMRAFELLCLREQFRLLVPPPKLCTDNGVMVAWNGIEKWRQGKDILTTIEEKENIEILQKCPLGPNVSEDLQRAALAKPDYIKF